MNQQNQLTPQDLQVLSEQQLEEVAGGLSLSVSVLRDPFPQGIPWPELFQQFAGNTLNGLQQGAVGF